MAAASGLLQTGILAKKLGMKDYETGQARLSLYALRFTLYARRLACDGDHAYLIHWLMLPTQFSRKKKKRVPGGTLMQEHSPRTQAATG
jgi:hypothetical protein